MSAPNEAACVELIDRVGPVQIVIGADVVLSLDGSALVELEPRLQAAARMVPQWAQAVAARHANSPDDLVLGVGYETAKCTRFVIREATLEEAAAAAIPLLRSTRGLQLRRDQASRIASVIEALIQRAEQPCRAGAA